MNTLTAIPQPASSTRNLHGTVIPCPGRSQRAAASQSPLALAITGQTPGRTTATAGTSSVFQSFVATWIMVLISISLSLFVISDVNGASVSTSLSQLPTSENETITRFNNTITNNDNAIYNSATFDLLGTYGAVMQGIKDNNSAYSALGLNDIGAQVGMTIRSAPTGEVNNGWVSNYDIATGKVNLSHIEGRAGTDYDVWNSADPNNDMMALTFNFGNMLDFNSNGAIDANEALYQNGYLENGFIGYEGGLGFGGNTPMFNYQIPEPSTTGLLGLGLAGALLYRRREPTQTPKNY